jgi:hypothetical protein
MSQSFRQSELFAGEDWRALYRAFTQINFNASDPPSIARAMREYIQTNFPEDFNDWIESQEFVYILELLAWLAGSLAFKTDINARENFLETAESRESVLRLARFLSYNPRRNYCAQGIVKLVEVQTDDDIIDSYGQNLNNAAIMWDNPDDPDWFEHFVLVLNNAFVTNNQFGQPLKSGTVSGVRTQLYRMNNRMNDFNNHFTSNASGERMSFELCNGDFETGGSFFEREPNPQAAFHLYYRNDGNGNTSRDTGFFMLFKQGQLARQTFSIDTPVENQVIDLDAVGVNETDVWVQSVDDAGSVQTEWTKVPTILSENITFNSIASSNRTIFSVITRDDDRVSIRFADGRFGAAPVGNIRIWYRTSNGFRYQIRPQEIDRLRLTLPYTNRRGVKKNLFLTFSLEESVSNSTPRESEEQIRRRAPVVYATQNRMVSGEDYNSFPLQSNVVIKMKAVNRVYSGHSRFIDLNDPTGSYQDTNVFADDGIFYKEREDLYLEVALTSRNSSEATAAYIQPMLNRVEVSNYVLDDLYRNAIDAPEGCRWRRAVGDERFSSTGYFSSVSDLTYFKSGAIVLVREPGRDPKWVAIGEIIGQANAASAMGYKGNVTLAEPVKDNAEVLKIIPRFSPSLLGSNIEDIKIKIGDSENEGEGTASSFTLWYDPSTPNNHWKVEGANSVLQAPAIRVLRADHIGARLWRFSARGIRYVFESEKTVHWYVDGGREVDANTGTQKHDLIRVFSTNPDLNARDEDGNLKGFGLRADFDLAINKLIRYADGFAEPRRVGVTFIDGDEDGVPDRPDTFVRLVSMADVEPRPESHLFWARQIDGTYRPTNEIVGFNNGTDLQSALFLPTGTVAYQADAITPSHSFWLRVDDEVKPWIRLTKEYRAALGRGPNVARLWFTDGSAEGVPLTGTRLTFQWKHYASTNRRIDPAQTNCIDMFVLTSEYDFLVRQWVANGANIPDMPLAPSELDLRIAFSSFDDFKMFSDELIWRPVQYKFLFGPGSDKLRAQFKVVKLASSPLSDGEIKSRVIRAINEYFDVNRWDFGETFYFTELAAYIHQQLAGVIGSVVIVPQNEHSSFGEGFEVRCRSDELFLSTAQVGDVSIINSNTPTQLRIR